jgi:hypothetical protein
MRHLSPQVLLYLKAHQLLSENNHQCILALQPNGSPVLYTPGSAGGGAAAMPALVLERVQQLLVKTPAAGAFVGLFGMASGLLGLPEDDAPSVGGTCTTIVEQQCSSNPGIVQLYLHCLQYACCTKQQCA